MTIIQQLYSIAKQILYFILSSLIGETNLTEYIDENRRKNLKQF